MKNAQTSSSMKKLETLQGVVVFFVQTLSPTKLTFVNLCSPQCKAIIESKIPGLHTETHWAHPGQEPAPRLGIGPNGRTVNPLSVVSHG